jgi:hypothetical protein
VEGNNWRTDILVRKHQNQDSKQKYSFSVLPPVADKSSDFVYS